MSSGNNISYQHVNTRRRIDLLTNNPAFSVSSSRIDRKSERFQVKHRCLSKYLRFKARLTWRLSLKSDNYVFWKIWVEVVVIRIKEPQESTENSFCVAKNSNWTVWSLPLAESAEYSGACALVWCPRKPFNTINHLSGEEAKRQFNVGV